MANRNHTTNIYTAYGKIRTFSQIPDNHLRRNKPQQVTKKPKQNQIGEV